MTLSGVIALILRFFTEFDGLAGQLRHCGWRQTYDVRRILSPSSSLPVLAIIKLTHPAARTTCLSRSQLWELFIHLYTSKIGQSSEQLLRFNNFPYGRRHVFWIWPPVNVEHVEASDTYQILRYGWDMPGNEIQNGNRRWLIYFRLWFWSRRHEAYRTHNASTHRILGKLDSSRLISI